MASKQWSEKQTKEVIKNIIRQAEVSRIARLLQHRLALATVKTQNGWENLTLDAIEPKIEEGLRRKRQKSSQSQGGSPSPQKQFFSDGDLEWLRRNRTTCRDGRPPSQSSAVGPLPTFPGRNSRKRTRVGPDSTSQSSKRHRTHGRMIQSSPGYYEIPGRGSPESRRAFQPTFHSSPPRTPPRKMLRMGRGDKNNGEEGADLLLYLATSPSPATAAIQKSRYVPTTPPSRSSVLPSSMMHTPGAPQTPQTAFNFADFVNITPSPAQGAFGPVGRGTPIANARRRLNFDQLAPPSGSPNQPSGSTRGNGLGMELGGELVS